MLVIQFHRVEKKLIIQIYRMEKMLIRLFSYNLWDKKTDEKAQI